MSNALRMADWNSNKSYAVWAEIRDLRDELHLLDEGSLFLSHPLTEGAVRREIKGKLKRRELWYERQNS